MYETWLIEEKKYLYFSYFRDFECCWVDAEKTHTRGRPSGGSIFGFKKGIKNRYCLKFDIVDEYVVLRAKLDNENVMFIPTYLNNWTTDFAKLKRLLENKDTVKFFILGDFNSRTACNQKFELNVLDENRNLKKVRDSKDNVFDGRGRSILDLFNDTGCVILNGRSPSDSEGEITFANSNGSSVIDYCACSLNAIKWIEDFAVLTKPYSDHQPIKLKIKSQMDAFLGNELNMLPKMLWSKHNERKYSSEIQKLCNLNDYENCNTNQRVSILKHKVMQAAGTLQVTPKNFAKNKWFDLQCYNAREKVFKKLKLYRKHGGIPSIRQEYFESRKRYVNLCVQKRKKYHNETIDKLNYVKNPKEWWRLANEVRNRKFSVSGYIDIQDFVSHFEQLLAPSPTSAVMSYAAPQNEIQWMDEPFQLEEIKVVLKTAKDRKAPGMDRIPYEFYKYGCEDFTMEIKNVLNSIYQSECVPESFKESIIFPLFKKGDNRIVDNYRGLSFINTLCKIFTGVLLQRINKWSEDYKILHESQAGFRKKYSTDDNIFNLSSLAHLQLAKKKKLYVFFVDFKSAFDTVCHSSLFYKLHTLGLSSKVIRILRGLYKNTKSAIWNGDKISNFFEVHSGVKQGCLLSPTLFALFINDLYDYLPGGIKVKNTILKLLMYADDLVLIAEDKETLQKMINKLADYCNLWNLVVNLNKSKVLVFRKGTRLPNNEKWFFNSEPIEVVNHYKYLGVIFNYNMAYSKHLSEKLEASKNAINSTWNTFIKHKDIALSKKIKIFLAASRSIMCYAGAIWGFKEHEPVEKLQRYFLKKVFNLPSNTPTYMLHIETGLHKLFLYTLSLHFNYVNRVMEYTEERYPKLLATEALTNKLYWAKEWRLIFQKVAIEFNYNTIDIRNWKCQQKEALNKLALMHWNVNVERARASQFHDEYCNLKYHDVPNYFNDQNPREMISLIFRARGGLLNINARAFKADTIGICTICNMDKAENTFHFISQCPIFKQYRQTYFGKKELTHDEFIDILNGKEYACLFRYIKASIRYRHLILSEAM